MKMVYEKEDLWALVLAVAMGLGLAAALLAWWLE